MTFLAKFSLWSIWHQSAYTLKPPSIWLSKQQQQNQALTPTKWKEERKKKGRKEGKEQRKEGKEWEWEEVLLNFSRYGY